MLCESVQTSKRTGVLAVENYYQPNSKSRAEVTQRYMNAAPIEVGNRAVLIADTAKLIALLLEDSMDIPGREIPIDVLIKASIFACSETMD